MGNFYQNVADTVSNNMADRQNAAALGTFANTALQVYQQHLQQQKLDTLANMLMASQNKQADQSYAVANAKPATAVSADDPDLQGTAQYNPAGGNVFQYTDGASPGDPPTDAQMAAHNADLGYSYNENPTLPSAPGDMPATGGMAGLKLSLLMDQANTRNLTQQARMKALLANASTAPARQDILTQRLQNMRATAADPTTGLTPNQVRQQGNFTTNQTRLQQTYGPGGTAAIRPQADSVQKLNSDLQTKYGIGISDLQSAGQEDIVPQNNGVLYRLGGGKGANGAVQPKTSVLISQADHDQFLQRYNAIQSGNPQIINQPQMSAVQMYRNALNTGGAPASVAQPGATASDPISAAQDAISRGADPDAVKARLQANGIDTTGL